MLSCGPMLSADPDRSARVTFTLELVHVLAFLSEQGLTTTTTKRHATEARNTMPHTALAEIEHRV
eukprot:1982228-Pyramimonas_sp.AAC.1